MLVLNRLVLVLIHMIVGAVTNVLLHYLPSGDLRTFKRVALNSRSLVNMGGYRGIDQDNIIYTYSAQIKAETFHEVSLSGKFLHCFLIQLVWLQEIPLPMNLWQWTCHRWPFQANIPCPSPKLRRSLWQLHVRLLFEVSIEESWFHVQMFAVPTFSCCNCNHKSNNWPFNSRNKSVLVFDFM